MAFYAYISCEWSSVFMASWGSSLEAEEKTTEVCQTLCGEKD